MLDLLADARFANVLHSFLPAHRERLYPPTGTLVMFVSQALSGDRSCQRAVDERIVRALARGTPAPVSSTAAYCEARQRLPLALVSVLCREVALRARDRRPSRPTWMDKERYAAAPTSMTLRVVISRRKGCCDKTLLSPMLDHARKNLVAVRPGSSMASKLSLAFEYASEISSAVSFLASSGRT